MINQCGDVQIYYREYGEGHPLILLHGNGDSGKYFKKQLPVFSKKFRVFTPDTRGQGKSQEGSEGMHYDLFAEDLRRFMDSMELESAHILGFSDGGITALLFAIKYPDRVDKLILNGANLDPSGIRSKYLTMFRLHARLLGIFSKNNARMRLKKELLELMLNEPHIDTEELHSVQNKTLVIAGEKDMIAEAHTRRIAENIPGAELKILPMADHMCAAKQPEVFNLAVMDFLMGNQLDGDKVRTPSVL